MHGSQLRAEPALAEAPGGRPHLRAVLAPRRIAIVGASRNPRSLAGRYLDHLLKHEFPGEIIPINRAADEVRGLPAFPSLEAVPDPVDCALITIPGDAAFEAARVAAALDVPLTVMFTSGFAELGEAGRARQAELTEMFRSSRGRLLGPNCPGFVNTHASVAASVSAFVGGHEIPPGAVGIASQSGAVGGLIAERVLDAGASLSQLIFTGNEADVEIGEAVEALALEPACRVVTCFVEGLSDPERAAAGIRFAREQGKPVLVLATGRSEEGRRAAALHTGKLVTVGQGERALLEQGGAVLVDDLAVLAEAAVALATGDARSGGRRVGIVSTTGGLGGIAADQVREVGASLPRVPESVQATLAEQLPHYASTENPCDLADALTTVDELLQTAIAAFGSSGCYDALVVTMAVHPDWLADRLATDLVAATAATALPVIVLWPGGSMGSDAVAKAREGGVPVVESAPACGVALAAWARPAPDGRAPESLEPLAPAGGPRERDIKTALSEAGLEMPRSHVATSVDEVARAFRTLKSVAVMKAHDPVLDHKAGLGLVQRGVSSHRQATKVWRDFQRAADEADIELNEVLLEEEVHELGTEVLVSVRRTPLGLEVLIGPGGSTAELRGPRPLRIGPLSDDQCDAMGHELGIAEPRLPALRTAISAIQRLALAYGPALGVLEVNPVLLTSEGPIALDAKLRLAEGQR
jgi:acyl-CoA synthetase (NDP forming)